MAIKLSGSVCRKVPIPGLEYSSQSYSAGMEIEISCADAGEVQAKLAQLYRSLNQGIDAQIAASQPNVVQRQPTAPPVPPPNGVNRVAAVTNGNRVTATEAQVKCIHAIVKKNGVDLVPILAAYKVADVRDLPVRDASQLIDQLKAQNGNGATAH